MVNLKKLAKKLLKKHKIRLTKKLGQNFLIDPAYIKKEVEMANIENKKIIEIGAGLGFLTKELAKSAKEVLAIEKDVRFKPILEEQLADAHNIELIFEDVLRVDLPKWKVVSNLPYYISSQITFKLLENGNQGVLCFQQEFAQRMFAKPGNRSWGRLSVNCQLLSEVKKLFKIPRAAFWPQPKVDSMVISLKPKKPPKNYEKIKKIVDKLFLYPNKTLGKVEKITGIQFPASMSKKRVRELDLNQLVVAVKLIK